MAKTAAAITSEPIVGRKKIAKISRRPNSIAFLSNKKFSGVVMIDPISVEAAAPKVE
jgi:hypothetical protein